MFFPIRDLNPRRRFPAVTLGILLLNAAVFLYQLTLDSFGRQLFTLTAGAIPAEITHLVDIYPRDVVPPPLTILTSMFMHGGLLHILGNMWFLWLFGDNVEDALGHLRYAIFYLAVGVVGALAQSFAAPDSTIPMVGASGAIAGVLGAYIMLFPRARVDTLVFLFIFVERVALPAWIFLGLWFVGQFFIDPGAGVAWMAHVGGFLAGIGLVRMLLPLRRRPPRASDVEYIPPGRW